jgi:hypothetical protein
LFVGQLQSGATRASVAQALLNSREYLGRAVDGMYLDYLNRNADAAGREYWVNQLAAGMSPEGVAAGLLGSDEYSLLHATNEAFVAALYQDILGRAADAGGQAHFLSRLQSGAIRVSVIGDLLASEERSRVLVQAAYTQALDRTADAAALNAYASQLRSGTITMSALLANLYGSDEFLLKLLA